MWDCLQLHPDFLSRLVTAANIANYNDPNNSEVHFIMLCLALSCNIGHSNDQLNEALLCVKLNPEVADYHFMLANVYSNMNMHELALKCFDRALELEFKPEWLYDRAETIALWVERTPNPRREQYLKVIQVRKLIQMGSR